MRRLVGCAALFGEPAGGQLKQCGGFADDTWCGHVGY